MLSTTDLDGEGSLDDLSTKDKDSHRDSESSSGRILQSRDPSIDSALSSADGGCTSTGGSSHMQRFSTNSSSTTGDDEMAVKYNLREQFIDYVPSRQRKSQQPQQQQQQQQPRNIVTCTISSTTASLKNGSEIEQRRGSELQRQKPIVMRSISGGGYESPKSCAGLQRAATTMATMETSSSSSSSNINNNNNNNDEDERKTKSQSIEDEPIMV